MFTINVPFHVFVTFLRLRLIDAVKEVTQITYFTALNTSILPVTYLIHTHLTFLPHAYACTHPQVLNNLQLRASAGQTVALVGPSGSGKSTVIDLIQRFFELGSAGQVRSQFKLSLCYEYTCTCIIICLH